MKKILSLLFVFTLVLMALTSCNNAKKSYEKLDEHILASSTAIDGANYMTIGSGESGGATYVRSIKRTAAQIELILSVYTNGNMEKSFTLILNKSSFDSYKWYYSSDVSGITMSGLIIPDDYKRASTTISALSVNVKDEYVIASTATLAKAMCNYLLDSLKIDLSGLGLSAVDFGFEDYENYED